jgi:hypothetical protein
MAATTTLLGLVTPTQGDLSGTWGDTVNYGITDYVDIAIAGTLSFADDGAITLANTTGSASGNGFTTTTAQYMVIRITGTQSVVKVITGPSYSKLYMVDHAGATSAVTFKAAGQTGVSVAVGEKCFVYYNGTDYVKVASSVVDGVSTISFGSTGLTPATATSGAVTVAGTLAVLNGGTGVTTSTGTGSTVLSVGPTFTGTPLAPTATTGTNTTQIATTAFVQNQIGAIAAGVSSFSAGTTGLTPSTASTGVVTLAGTLVTANGGTGNANGTVAKLATTNFTIEESGGNLVFKYGATTIASMTSAGVFTTLSDITGNGTP